MFRDEIMVRIRDLDAKQYFIILIGIIIMFDLTILLHIPFLRQIIGFLCSTIIPGLLILHILKLSKIEFLKKFVLSVGLSIALLMFTGLLVNSFYPIILKPLSLQSLLISFNIILVILAFIAYKRNKNEFNVENIFNFKKFDLQDKLISPLIFPIIFPFLAIFGAYMMNTQGNNTILLAMLSLIPTYVVAVVILRDRIPEATYPIAVLMIGMALSLMYGLRGYNITTGDASTEYYVFYLTLNNFHWEALSFYDNVNACLSVTILPVLYRVLLGMEGIYVFKVLYNLFLSIIPLCTYLLVKKYMENHYAFLSSIFFMAQHPFISILGWIIFRQIVAQLFFVLSILVLFDDKINGLNKKLLFIIFMVGVILSHYATAYIFFILVLLYWLVVNLRTITTKIDKMMTSVLIIIFFIFIFLWYAYIAEVPFNSAINFIKRNLINFIYLFSEGIQSEKVILVKEAEQIPEKISVIIYNISFIFISIGVLTLIKKRKHTKFDEKYILMMFLCLCLLALLVVISPALVGYGPDRVYQQLLVFLAPAFVIGGKNISKFISRLFNSKLDLSLTVILIVLILQFFSATYLIFQFCGVPRSEVLNSDGIRHELYYVYDMDVAGARWIYNHKINELDVWGDYPGSFIYGQLDKVRAKGSFSSRLELKDEYIYLRTVNTVKGHIYLTWGVKESISNYINLFLTKNKVYGNGGSEIYK